MKPEGVYYNEWDPFCAQWLRNLMKKRAIPEGDVDERSIQDVTPQEVKLYRECHFFAGIGTWAYVCKKTEASRNVRSLWTASLPCQPFSEAGARNGFADERHLWPDFHWLVRWVRPELLFGEQVARSGGADWIALVRHELAQLGYVSGHVDIPACLVGAPHERLRTYWMAYHQNKRQQRTALAKKALQPARSGTPLRPYAWPDGCGSESTVAVHELLSKDYGTSSYVGRKRAYGNAIVAPLAIEFVRAALRVMP